MQAPNKVYILPSQHNLQYDNGGEEYIRKDALLEWAKEQIKDYADSLPEEIGWDDALKAVINKINSL